MGTIDLSSPTFVVLFLVGVCAMVYCMLADFRSRTARKAQEDAELEAMERAEREMVLAREAFREKRARRQQEAYDLQFKLDQQFLKAQLESFEKIPAAGRDDMDRYDRYMVRQAEVVKYPMPKEDE